MTGQMPGDAITDAAIDAFTVACAKASSVPGATAGDCYRAGLAAALPALTGAIAAQERERIVTELPDDAVTPAEQRAAEALWKSGACEPQEAAALARIALTAALPALTGAITAQAATAEREACAQLADDVGAVYPETVVVQTGVDGVVWHRFADVLGGAADGAHTPGGAT